MTENPNDDPQTRRYVGTDAPESDPEPRDIDPPQGPSAEDQQRENAETSLDQPSEDPS